MIQDLEKIIRERWNDFGFSFDFPKKIYFLKMQGTVGIINKKVVFLVFFNNDQQPALCITTIREPAYNYLIKNENEAINYCFNKLNESLIKDSIIKPFFTDNINNHLIFFQEAVSGQKIKRNNDDEILKICLTWLLEFCKNMIEKVVVIDNEFIEQQIINPFDKLESGYQIKNDKFIDIKEKLIKDFRLFIGLKLPLIKQHGDFHFSNVFLNNSKIKVIDFEYFNQFNLPVFDLFYFLDRWGNDCSTLKNYNKEINYFFEQLSIPKKLIKSLWQLCFWVAFLRKIHSYQIIPGRKLELEYVIKKYKKESLNCC